jgi:hypothetical protein
MKNYKVNVDRQKPNSDEILSKRNFDGLMQQYKAAAAAGQVAHKPFYKSGWFLGSAFAAAAVVAVAVVVMINREDVMPSAANNLPVTNNAAPDTRHAGDTNAHAIAQKRTIAPPIKGLDVRYTSYKVAASKATTITHPSGSKLVIPANAFVDKEGNPVSGEVEVRYREFRNPVDVFVAGIPMEYDSAGRTYQFESAGMMQVAAFVNGKVVYLDKNKPVEVQFASKQSGEEFAVYEFDTAAGNWAYRGEDEISLPPSAASKPKLLTADEVNRKKAAAATQLQQDLSVAVRQNPVPAEPVKPRLADKRKNRFRVDFKPSEFPEMSAWKDVVFEVDESREKFDTNFYYNTKWESVVLSKGASEGRYVATFKKGLTIAPVDVYPVYEGESYQKAKESFDKKFAEYDLALSRRTTAETAARTRYEETITGLGLSGGLTQVQNLANQASLDLAGQVMRIFTIANFGLFNCDQPQMLPIGGKVALACNDNEGKLLSGFTILYHVDRAKFCLYSYHNQNPMVGFQFDPQSSNLVWAVRDGILYTADDDQFKTMPLSGTAGIQMKPVTRTFNSAVEMRIFLNIPVGI